MTTNQAQRQSTQSQNVSTRANAVSNYNHYDEHWDNGGAVAAGFVAGAAVRGVAAAAAQPVVVAPAPVAVLPCTPTMVSVGGVTYQQCGSTYYTQSYSGGQAVYVQTAPPPGY